MTEKEIPMTDPFAITIAISSLAISILTFYLTYFRRGTVLMSQPTVIFFGPDGKGKKVNRAEHLPSKVYFRALLFSTAKRGRIIESMHITVARSEAQQNFSVWVHGEKDKLVRGSGLFVGESGVATDHHFLLPKDIGQFKWLPGGYEMTVFARIHGDCETKELFRQELTVTKDDAQLLETDDNGIYFDWGPDSLKYYSHIKNIPEEPDFLKK
jgi:hypothetical protein